jgi:hypothetical protein
MQKERAMVSLIKFATFLSVVAPTLSFLNTPRAIFSEIKPRLNKLSVQRATSTIDNANTASFDEWLSDYRGAAATASVDEDPVVVVDAGLDVDTSFTFSGVIWQVILK